MKTIKRIIVCWGSLSAWLFIGWFTNGRENLALFRTIFVGLSFIVIIIALIIVICGLILGLMHYEL